MSGVLSRTTAGPSLMRSLRRGLETGFRHGAGVGYSAWASYELVDAETAMVTTGMDILPEARPRVVADAMAVLRRLRDRGPDPADLHDEIEGEVRRVKTEPAENWMPYLAAREALLDRPIKDRDQLIAEAEATTVEGVRQAAYVMWRNLLVSIDPDTSTDPQLTWLEGPRFTPLEVGQHFKPAGWPVTKGRLTIADHAAQLITQQGATSARYDQLAAVVAYPDGGRQLIRRDGYQVLIEPGYWKDGQQAAMAVDAATSPLLRIPMPARAPDEIPRSTVTRWDKVAHWVKRPDLWVVAALAVVVIVALATSTEIGDLLPRAIGIGLLTGVVLFFQRRKD
jgi:zinc protease